VTSELHISEKSPQISPKIRFISIETGLVLAAVLVGGFLRGYRFADLGISHFDAGIYALSGLWPWTGRFEPFQHLYSPAVFPILVGLASLVQGGPSELSGSLVSFSAGTAMILLVWSVGRSWWGREVGILAAWVVALDGMQIVFSRAGITDAAFSFGMLLAIYLVRKAIKEGGFAVILGAGLAVGFTWNIKYNGFLAIVYAVCINLELSIIQQARRIIVVGLLALGCYLPWAIHVESMPGGYRALVDHHQGYWQGWSGLVDNWVDAVQAASLISHPWTGLLAAVMLMTIGRLRWSAVWAAMAIGLMAISGASMLTWVCLAMIGVGLEGKHRTANAWMLGCLLLLPGLYSFYLRLWLPAETMLLLFGALGVVRLASMCDSESWRRRITIGSLAVMLISGGILWNQGWARDWNPLPEVSTGYRKTAKRLSEWSGENNKQLRTLVRPPLRYYLLTASPSIRLLPPLPGQAFDVRQLSSDEALVVDSRMAHDSPQFAKSLETQSSLLRLVTTFHVEPNMVTMLDDYDADRLPVSADEYVIQVYVRVLGDR